MITTINSPTTQVPFYSPTVATTASTNTTGGTPLPLSTPPTTINQPLPTIPSFNTLNTSSVTKTVTAPVNATPSNPIAKAPLTPSTPEQKPNNNNNLSGKLLLFGGLLAAGVVAYLIFKNNRPKSDCPYEDDQRLLDITSSWRR